MPHLPCMQDKDAKSSTNNSNNKSCDRRDELKGGGVVVVLGGDHPHISSVPVTDTSRNKTEDPTNEDVAPPASASTIMVKKMDTTDSKTESSESSFKQAAVVVRSSSSCCENESAALASSSPTAADSAPAATDASSPPPSNAHPKNKSLLITPSPHSSSQNDAAGDSPRTPAGSSDNPDANHEPPAPPSLTASTGPVMTIHGNHHIFASPIRLKRNTARVVSEDSENGTGNDVSSRLPVPTNLKYHPSPSSYWSTPPRGFGRPAFVSSSFSGDQSLGETQAHQKRPNEARSSPPEEEIPSKRLKAEAPSPDTTSHSVDGRRQEGHNQGTSTTAVNVEAPDTATKKPIISPASSNEKMENEDESNGLHRTGSTGSSTLGSYPPPGMHMARPYPPSYHHLYGGPPPPHHYPHLHHHHHHHTPPDGYGHSASSSGTPGSPANHHAPSPSPYGIFGSYASPHRHHHHPHAYMDYRHCPPPHSSYYHPGAVPPPYRPHAHTVTSPYRGHPPPGVAPHQHSIASYHHGLPPHPHSGMATRAGGMVPKHPGTALSTVSSGEPSMTAPSYHHHHHPMGHPPPATSSLYGRPESSPTPSTSSSNTNATIKSVADWQRAARTTGKVPSANRCVPLQEPIPSKYWGEAEKTKDAVLPDFHRLVNFPDYLAKPRSSSGVNSDSIAAANGQSGKRHCVMCGKLRVCSATSLVRGRSIKSASEAKDQQPKEPDEDQDEDGTSHIIPRQNKGLCTACDVTVWVVVADNLEIKWCKGCKNFRPWAAFGDKGSATKCVRCRDRQREKYAMQKDEIRFRRYMRTNSDSAVSSSSSNTTDNQSKAATSQKVGFEDKKEGDHHLAAARGLSNLMKAATTS